MGNKPSFVEPSSSLSSDPTAPSVAACRPEPDADSKSESGLSSKDEADAENESLSSCNSDESPDCHMSSEEDEADVEKVFRVPTGVHPDSVPAPQEVPFKRISDGDLEFYRTHLPTYTEFSNALHRRDAEDPKVPPPQQFGFLPMCDEPSSDWKGQVHSFGIAVVDTKLGRVYRQLQMNLVYTPRTLSLPYRRVSGSLVHLDSQENHDFFVAWYEDVVVSILEDLTGQNGLEIATRLHGFIQAVVLALPIVLYKIVQRAASWCKVSNALIKDVFMIRHPFVVSGQDNPVRKFKFRFADILGSDFGNSGFGVFSMHVCSLPNGNRQPAHKPGTACCFEHAEPVLDPRLLSTFMHPLTREYRNLFEIHYLFIKRDDAASTDRLPFPESTAHWRKPLASFGCAFGDFIGLDTHRMVGIKLDAQFVQRYRNLMGHTKSQSSACGVTIMAYKQKPCLVEWTCKNRVSKSSTKFLEGEAFCVLWAAQDRQLLPYYPAEVKPVPVEIVSPYEEIDLLNNITAFSLGIVTEDREGALHAVAVAAWFLADHFREVSVEWLKGIEHYFANREMDYSKIAADIRMVRMGMAARMPRHDLMTRQCKGLVEVLGFYNSGLQTGALTLHDSIPSLAVGSSSSSSGERSGDDNEDETYTEALQAEYSKGDKAIANRKRKRRRGKNRSGRKPPAKRVKTDV